MGCDGGTIPKRHELVRTKQKPEQKDVDMARTAKWKCCAITQNPLVQPIVACEMGNLYNKEAILEYLLNKSSCDSIPHVRGLKDVKELKLTKNGGYDNNKLGELADKYYDTQAASYICPVAGLEMNGKYPFGFVWSCGCVISLRALKEVKSEVCHKCGKAFQQQDFVLLNSDGEDLEKTKTQMENRRAEVKLKKKSTRSKTETSTLTSSSTTSVSNTDKSKKTRSSSIKKETKHGPTTNKKTKIDPDNQLSKLSKYKTVSEDPNASKVFKSLFTSSETAKNRPSYKQSNWVTYNPYHL